MEKMISDPETYFRQFVPPRDALLEQLEAEADAEEIPIVGPLVGRLLAMLAQISGARRILELGAATGYSAIFLARGSAATGGRVTTVEMDADLASRAKRNFGAAGVADRIELIVGSAETALATLAPAFDMVFMDIDKDAYGPSLDGCRRLLRPGGLLVADNTAFNDARGFNQRIAESHQWMSIQLYAFWPFHSPEEDGVCLAIRI